MRAGVARVQCGSAVPEPSLYLLPAPPPQHGHGHLPGLLGRWATAWLRLRSRRHACGGGRWRAAAWDVRRCRVVRRRQGSAAEAAWRQADLGEDAVNAALVAREEHR